MAAVITTVTVNCATSRITIAGTGLPTSGVLLTITVDDVVTGYTVISSISTQTVIEFNPFVDGEYCIAYNEDYLITSDGDTIQSSNSATIYTAVTSGFTCAELSCAFHVTETATEGWKLYRFDLKIRPEETM